MKAPQEASMDVRTIEAERLAPVAELAVTTERPRAGALTVAAPPRASAAVLARAFQLADITVLTVLALAAMAAASPIDLLNTPLGLAAPFVAAWLALVWGLSAAGAWRFEFAETVWDRLGRISGGLVSALFIALIAAGLANMPAYAWPAFAAQLGAASLLIIALHIQYLAHLRRLARDGRLSPRVAIVGATEHAHRLLERNAATHELTVLGVFDDRKGRAPSAIAGSQVLGDTYDLLAWDSLPDVDKIIICVPHQADRRVRELIDRLRSLPHEIALILETDFAVDANASLARVARVPMARIAGGHQDEVKLIVKRVEDVVIGAAALVLAAPIMALIAVLVKLDSPGPILFRQKRHGFNNRIIDVLKFRTMRHSPQGDIGPMRQVEAGDKRVTRLGRFLRKTSLDELPQIWNVLRGEMSLVGPRPHAVDMRTGETETAKLLAEYAHRHRVKPGITGWAQINGSRGPVHTVEELQRRVRLDIAYIEHQSLWLDLLILARTVPCLLGDKLNTR
ncbi:MAG: exopolysaccharide biosynthesis polyprenyl glycosylphosphotransferase [Maricaulaceae bacterium]